MIWETLSKYRLVMRGMWETAKTVLSVPTILGSHVVLQAFVYYASQYRILHHSSIACNDARSCMIHHTFCLWIESNMTDTTPGYYLFVHSKAVQHWPPIEMGGYHVGDKLSVPTPSYRCSSYPLERLMLLLSRSWNMASVRRTLKYSEMKPTLHLLPQPELHIQISI